MVTEEMAFFFVLLRGGRSPAALRLWLEKFKVVA
jgi:hypothetical protein